MHCEILVYGAEVIVRDLGSRNGTWVSGRRLVNQQCQIRAGDIIRFGPVEARLEMDIPREEPDSEESGYFDLSKLEAATAARREKEQHAKVHWPLQNAVTERTLELLHPPAKSDTELTPAPAAPAPTQLHRSRIILAAALIIAAAFFLFRFLLRRFPFG